MHEVVGDLDAVQGLADAVSADDVALGNLDAGRELAAGAVGVTRERTDVVAVVEQDAEAVWGELKAVIRRAAAGARDIAAAGLSVQGDAGGRGSPPGPLPSEPSAPCASSWATR